MLDKLNQDPFVPWNHRAETPTAQDPDDCHRAPTHPLTHPLTHPPTHPPTHSPTHPFTHEVLASIIMMSLETINFGEKKALFPCMVLKIKSMVLALLLVG